MPRPDINNYAPGTLDHQYFHKIQHMIQTLQQHKRMNDVSADAFYKWLAKMRRMTQPRWRGLVRFFKPHVVEVSAPGYLHAPNKTLHLKDIRQVKAFRKDLAYYVDIAQRVLEDRVERDLISDRSTRTMDRSVAEYIRDMLQRKQTVDHVKDLITTMRKLDTNEPPETLERITTLRAKMKEFTDRKKRLKQQILNARDEDEAARRTRVELRGYTYETEDSDAEIRPTNNDNDDGHGPKTLWFNTDTLPVLNARFSVYTFDKDSNKWYLTPITVTSKKTHLLRKLKPSPYQLNHPDTLTHDLDQFITEFVLEGAQYCRINDPVRNISNENDVAANEARDRCRNIMRELSQLGLEVRLDRDQRLFELYREELVREPDGHDPFNTLTHAFNSANGTFMELIEVAVVDHQPREPFDNRELRKQVSHVPVSYMPTQHVIFELNPEATSFSNMFIDKYNNTKLPNSCMADAIIRTYGDCFYKHYAKNKLEKHKKTLNYQFIYETLFGPGTYVPGTPVTLTIDQAKTFCDKVGVGLVVYNINMEVMVSTVADLTQPTWWMHPKVMRVVYHDNHVEVLSDKAVNAIEQKYSIQVYKTEEGRELVKRTHDLANKIELTAKEWQKITEWWKENDKRRRAHMSTLFRKPRKFKVDAKQYSIACDSETCLQAIMQCIQQGQHTIRIIYNGSLNELAKELVTQHHFNSLRYAANDTHMTSLSFTNLELNGKPVHITIAKPILVKGKVEQEVTSVDLFVKYVTAQQKLSSLLFTTAQLTQYNEETQTLMDRYTINVPSGSVIKHDGDASDWVEGFNDCVMVDFVKFYSHTLADLPYLSSISPFAYFVEVKETGDALVEKVWQAPHGVQYLVEVAPNMPIMELVNKYPVYYKRYTRMFDFELKGLMGLLGLKKALDPSTGFRVLAEIKMIVHDNSGVKHHVESCMNPNHSNYKDDPTMSDPAVKKAMMGLHKNSFNKEIGRLGLKWNRCTRTMLFMNQDDARIYYRQHGGEFGEYTVKTSEKNESSESSQHNQNSQGSRKRGRSCSDRCDRSRSSDYGDYDDEDIQDYEEIDDWDPERVRRCYAPQGGLSPSQGSYDWNGNAYDQGSEYESQMQMEMEMEMEMEDDEMSQLPKKDEEKQKMYFWYKSIEVPLQNGYWPMRDSIYSLARFKVFELHTRIMEEKPDWALVAIKTDALYYTHQSGRPLQPHEYTFRSDGFVANLLAKTWGGITLHTSKTEGNPIIPNKGFVTVLPCDVRCSRSNMKDFYAESMQKHGLYPNEWQTRWKQSLEGSFHVARQITFTEEEEWDTARVIRTVKMPMGFPGEVIVMSPAGCGKSYAAIHAAIELANEKEGKVLVVTPYNRQKRDVRFTYKVQSVTYHTFMGEGIDDDGVGSGSGSGVGDSDSVDGEREGEGEGEREGEGASQKSSKNKRGLKNALAANNIVVVVFDEILLLKHSQIVKVWRFMKENPEVIVMATGDPFQNEAIGDVIDNDLKSHYLRRMFSREVKLMVNKRLKTPEDRAKLKAFSEDLFSNNKNTIEAVIRRHFGPDKMIENLSDLNNRGFQKAVAYFNWSSQTLNKSIRDADRSSLVRGVKGPNDIEYRPGDELVCREAMSVATTASPFSPFLKGKSGKMYTNYNYKIENITRDHEGKPLFILSEVDVVKDDPNDADVYYPVTMLQVVTRFALPYVATCHSSQGSKIDQKFAIADWKTRNITKNWVYTAVTRTTRWDDVYFLDYSLFTDNLETAAKEMIRGYKRQDEKAKRKWREEDYVTVEWILQAWKKSSMCRGCGVHMSFEKTCANKVTVNRLNNALPHERSNCELLCKICNCKKLKD